MNEFIDLAKYRLEKAKNTLLDAKKYIGDATLESTVNRIYYAMFYAVNALLITEKLSSSKHSGVRALFNREVINKGLIEKQWGEFYSEMFDKRQIGIGFRLAVDTGSIKRLKDKSCNWLARLVCCESIYGR